MGNYENKLIDAIEAVVDDKIKNAGYDRTILAKIVSCVDPTIGKYRVRYQDSTFFAYAITTEVQYTPGAEVYILIASNDTSKDKTILGSVDKLGSNYTVEPDEEEHYEVVGSNCIESKDKFEFCSYSGNVTKIVYDRDNVDNTLINLNTLSVETYIRESGSIVCGGTFQTALPAEQQLRGNYGIIFELAFLDNASSDIVYKQYYVDVNQMLGNPYILTKPTRQVSIFDIDAANFQYVNKISLFIENFPHTRAGEPMDIFISNLELMGTIPLDDTDLDACALVVTTPDGAYFNIGDSDDKTLKLEAQVRVKGKIIDNNSQYLDYYWFIENALVNSSSDKYNQYGGNGWACLNDYNVISDGAVAWVPGEYQYDLKKSLCPAKVTMLKCVAVLNDLVLSKEVKITNYASLYDITVSSDSGTQFYYDIGNPNLTCLINEDDRDTDEYQYIWAEADFSGNFQQLAETTAENDEYNAAMAGYTQLLADIEAETAMAAASQEQLNEYLTTIKKYDKIIRVERNKIHSLNVSRITNFATYKCSVFKDDLFIGTGSLVLMNSLENADYYNIIINNGTQVYKYNEAGVSPLRESLLTENKMVIDQLSVSVFDCLGMLLDDEIIRKCNVEWHVPTVNTLLIAPDGYDEDTGTEKIYRDTITLDYSIATRYDINKNNNDIVVKIDYKGIPLMAKTNLTFTKEGEPGTNGTDFVAQIVPNATVSFYDYPMILNSKLNYTPLGDPTSQQWFRLNLWHNGEKIYDSSTSGTSTEDKTVRLEWDVLINTYKTDQNTKVKTKDNTDIEVVDKNKGYFKYKGYTNGSMPANIIKCTVQYDGVTYYATMPLITGKAESGYNVSLIEDTGFRFATYSADGRAPQYDNSNPFELKVTRVINGITEDVSTLTKDEAITYNWNVCGKIYEWDGSAFTFVNHQYLLEKTRSNLARNQKNYKPVDDFNGECVNVGLECILLNNAQAEIGRIHIPVHLMLNRYGQAALNGWDGNQVSIDEDGGFILAPQVGAGIKENDNSFTGALMGKVQEAEKKNIDVGLFAYNHGVRTYFLNAKDGSAIFGRKGNGQLVIDPSQDRALLYSNNFWINYDEDGKPTDYTAANEKHQGLLIDLTTPEIRFGSGCFSVNSQGYLTARGGGSIAGWNITDTQLYKGQVGMSSDNTYNTNIAFWAGSTNKDNAKFRVNFNGDLFASSANITGTVTANSGKIGNWTINEGSISNGAVTLRSDGTISFGDKLTWDGTTLKVDGTIESKNGHIGGWVIGSTELYSADNNVHLRSGTGDTLRSIEVRNGACYIQNNGYFYARNANIAGTISASEGNIGGWKIDSKGIHNSKSNFKIEASSEGEADLYWRNGDAFFYCGDHANHPIMSTVTVGKDGYHIYPGLEFDGTTVSGTSISDFEWMQTFRDKVGGTASYSNGNNGFVRWFCNGGTAAAISADDIFIDLPNNTANGIWVTNRRGAYVKSITGYIKFGGWGLEIILGFVKGILVYAGNSESEAQSKTGTTSPLIEDQV